MFTPLTKPALSELNLESGSLELWDEWLARWFDGASHAVGANAAVVFPKVALRYQQHPLPKPIESAEAPSGVAISVVWVRPGVVRKCWDTVMVGNQRQRQQRALARTAFMFWVRAELVDRGTGNAEKKCRDAAQLLFAILENSAARHPLVEKGIRQLRAETPQLVSEGSGSKPGDPAYALRLLNCTATLHYPVLSQTGGET